MDTGGTTQNGFSWLQLSGGAYPSVDVEFNTRLFNLSNCPLTRGFQIYDTTGPIQSTLAYNTLIAISSSGNNSMSYIMHVGGGTQYAAQVTAAVHDNYFDASGANGAFYPGVNNDGHTQRHLFQQL